MIASVSAHNVSHIELQTTNGESNRDRIGIRRSAFGTRYSPVLVLRLRGLHLCQTCIYVFAFTSRNNTLSSSIRSVFRYPLSLPFSPRLFFLRFFDHCSDSFRLVHSRPFLPSSLLFLLYFLCTNVLFSLPLLFHSLLTRLPLFAISPRLFRLWPSFPPSSFSLLISSDSLSILFFKLFNVVSTWKPLVSFSSPFPLASSFFLSFSPRPLSRSFGV